VLGADVPARAVRPADQLGLAFLARRAADSGQASNFLTLPTTQRWIIIALIVDALVWPFFGSRGAVDIATLILIYVMLGLGLNIVVGLAGLLDLGYVGFYAVGAYSYAPAVALPGLELLDLPADRRPDGRHLRLPARLPGAAPAR
jgi:ABC-type branched-subunit amino acid transport system permease subunit